MLHFPTNGFLTRGDRQRRRSVSRKRHPSRLVVTVSLDGDEHVNDEISGIKGGFERQIETFKALREIRGIRAVLGMTLSRFNAGTFRETFEAVQREIRRSAAR